MTEGIYSGPEPGHITHANMSDQREQEFLEQELELRMEPRTGLKMEPEARMELKTKLEPE
jgi:hypothetical protein